MNAQPLQYIVVRDRATIERLAKVQGFIGGASVVIAIVADPAASKYWLEDASAAAENMLLAIVALGYGSTWVEGEPMGRFHMDEYEDTFRIVTRNVARDATALHVIDVTCIERFVDTFQQVNAVFAETFSNLFGGGTARLDLVDEDDPLESGIDITAQPPGKRNQSVQLLSGGEKALTALSLLISLFRIKPSPFCILDEVDAPLDDANVERLADLVHAMTDHTQFVLITHNRRTMQRSDLLYGVTMEEPGVSKVVSVRLEN